MSAISHSVVEGARDNLFLFVSRELVEVNGVTRNPYCQRGVKRRVVHRRDKFFPVENIYIEVMRVLQEGSERKLG